MATISTHPQFPPAAAGRIAASLLNRHSAHEIAEAVEVLIDVLDLLGGDSDIEANGDELDGTNAEDEEGNNHLQFGGGGGCGPGCPISDPVELNGDEGDYGGEVCGV